MGWMEKTTQDPHSDSLAETPAGQESEVVRGKTSHGRTVRELLDMIKFEHTVFALPFAGIAALAAARGLPEGRTLLWILAAMVGARTAAMTFNRIVDTHIDADNPRTRDRALPAGRVRLSAAWVMLGLSVALFGFAAGMLGPLPWKLAPVAMVVLLGYSLCKRFTSWSHVILGLALAGAPLGAWIAVSGQLEPAAWYLALGVLTWTAGFDILYALQDERFDREQGLHSIPVRFGTLPSLWISRLLHGIALLAWARFNLHMEAHLLPWLAWTAVAIILAREQWVVRGGDLQRIDHAFFTLNSLVGPIIFLGFLLEWLQASRMA
jgi:4-hydroxybenzoate polyprenyltransferase